MCTVTEESIEGRVRKARMEESVKGERERTGMGGEDEPGGHLMISGRPRLRRRTMRREEGREKIGEWDRR